MTLVWFALQSLPARRKLDRSYGVLHVVQGMLFLSFASVPDGKSLRWSNVWNRWFCYISDVDAAFFHLVIVSGWVFLTDVSHDEILTWRPFPTFWAMVEK